MIPFLPAVYAFGFIIYAIYGYLEHKINSLAPSYQADFRRYIRIAKEFFNTADVREIRKIDLINYQKHLQQNFNIRILSLPFVEVGRTLLPIS